MGIEGDVAVETFRGELERVLRIEFENNTKLWAGEQGQHLDRKYGAHRKEVPVKYPKIVCNGRFVSLVCRQTTNSSLLGKEINVEHVERQVVQPIVFSFHDAFVDHPAAF